MQQAFATSLTKMIGSVSLLRDVNAWNHDRNFQVLVLIDLVKLCIPAQTALQEQSDQGIHGSSFPVFLLNALLHL